MDILVILVDSHQTMTGVGTLAAKGKWTTHHLWTASGAHSDRHWWPLLVSLYLYYWDLFYGTGCLNQSFSVPSSLFLYFVFSFSSLPSPYHDLCGPIHNFFKILYFWITISWNVTFSSCDMYKLCYFTNYFLSCVIWPLKKHVNLKKKIIKNTKKQYGTFSSLFIAASLVTYFLVAILAYAQMDQRACDLINPLLKVVYLTNSR